MVGGLPTRRWKRSLCRVRVVASTPTTPLFVSCAAGLTPGFERHHRQMRGGPDRPRPAAAVAVLQAITMALAPCLASASAISTPRSRENLRLVAIGQETGIGKIEIIFLRQAFAQGARRTVSRPGPSRKRQSAGWLAFRPIPETRRSRDRRQRCQPPRYPAISQSCSPRARVHNCCSGREVAMPSTSSPLGRWLTWKRRSAHRHARSPGRDARQPILQVQPPSHRESEIEQHRARPVHSPGGQALGQIAAPVFAQAVGERTDIARRHRPPVRLGQAFDPPAQAFGIPEVIGRADCAISRAANRR